MSFKQVAVVVAIAAVGYGVYSHHFKKIVLPNLEFEGATGQWVSLKDLQQTKDGLLLVFLLPGCPSSRFALDQVRTAYGANQSKFAFAGLLLGDRQQAEAYEKENAVPFPVYGLRAVRDPFQVNEIIDNLGSAHGLSTAVYGGTVVVLDHDLRVRLKLKQEEIREVGQQLQAFAF